MHLYARSVGLHLFQELSTLGQQLAHTLLFPPGLRQSIARVSSAHGATGPDIWRCAVRYWHRGASGVFCWPSPGTDI